MIKNKILTIIVVISFSILGVVILFVQSSKMNHDKNNFIRLFPPHPVDYLISLDLEYNSFYLAGASDSNIYLGNSTNPSLIFMVDYGLSKLNPVWIAGEVGGFNSATVRLHIEPPYFYLADGSKPAIARGNLSNYEVTTLTVDTLFFTESIAISLNTLIQRVYSRDHGRYVLVRRDFLRNKTTISSDIIERQVDGIFCTDGMLHVSKERNEVVYIYYYRNQFIKADTNLRISFRGKTIDTTSHAKLQVVTYKDGETYSQALAGQPVTVNKSSCISGGYLFVNSGLKADNETEKSDRDYSPIDVYSLNDGRYAFSFYIPNFRGSRLAEFTVKGDYFIARFDQYLQVYRMNYGITDHFAKTSQDPL